MNNEEAKCIRCNIKIPIGLSVSNNGLCKLCVDAFTSEEKLRVLSAFLFVGPFFGIGAGIPLGMLVDKVFKLPNHEGAGGMFIFII